MSTGKVFLGVLAGVAVGALAGVLFAPAKGSRTRRRIVKKGEDYVEEIKEKINEFLDSITEKFEHVKEDVTDFAEQSKAKADKEMKHANN